MCINSGDKEAKQNRKRSIKKNKFGVNVDDLFFCAPLSKLGHVIHGRIKSQLQRETDETGEAKMKRNEYKNGNRILYERGNIGNFFHVVSADSN